MGTASPRGSDGLRKALVGSVLAGLLNLAPTPPPPWRSEPRPGPAVVLSVGEPMPFIFRDAA